MLSAVIILVVHPKGSQAEGQDVKSSSKLGAADLKVTKNGTEYEVVSFDRLFFKYQPPFDVEHPDGTVTKGSGKHMSVPPEIMALNGKKIAIKGFMMPLENNGDNIKSFLWPMSWSHVYSVQC